MLECVAPQVDRLHIYLSGHVGYLKGLPDNCIQHKLQGDPYGDAGKFIGLEDAYLHGAYYLSFDDDLDYPLEYVETMIKGIERYRRKCVCSFHGRSFEQFPITDYYRDARRRYYCLRAVSRDAPVEVPGTGCMGFHTSALTLSMRDFPSRSMADVHMAVVLRRHRMDAICLAHDAGWLKHLPVDHSRSIYNRFKGACQEQTRRINEVFS